MYTYGCVANTLLANKVIEARKDGESPYADLIIMRPYI